MQSEICLGISNCLEERRVPNTVMLVTRTAFMLENQKDIDPESYFLTLRGSGNAGIVKE